MKLMTRSFQEGGLIPDRYAHDGGNVSPGLRWEGAPKQTKSFALIVDDPDAPKGDFVHWLVYNIPAGTDHLDEGLPRAQTLADGVRQGRNDFGEIGYGGPQPPSGAHRYYFHLYALDSDLPVPPGATREQVERALREHTLEECQIMGRYQRH
jgi:Raf kinase inhibitor-like YbhB/YbcL family protein